MDKRATACRLGLSDLIIMMYGNMIFAPRMDIDFLTEQRANHGRALDVPARVAASPRTIPLLEIMRLCGAPQHEIICVALAFDERHARSFFQKDVLPVAKFPIIRESSCVEIQTVFETVCEAFFFKRLRKRDLLLDIVGCARELNISSDDIEIVKVLDEKFRIAIRNRFRRRVLSRRADSHLVFAVIAVADHMADISDVDDAAYAIPSDAEYASDRIREDIGAQVTDECRAVDGRTASIHRDDAGLLGYEELFLP